MTTNTIFKVSSTSRPQPDGRTYGSAAKALALFEVLFRNPSEFVDRVRALAEVRFEPAQPPEFTSQAESLPAVLGALQSYLRLPLMTIASEFDAGSAPAALVGPIAAAHNADQNLAKALYVLCRALRPRVVVETGVGYGITSCAILRALDKNGDGTLHSIDLPPLPKAAERFVGLLVDDRLRRRWILHRGASRRVLPGLIQALGTVDLFCHDSLHTHRTMSYEFATVLPRLDRPGAVVSDDIQQNSAFSDLVSASRPAFVRVFQATAKQALSGLALYV